MTENRLFLEIFTVPHDAHAPQAADDRLVKTANHGEINLVLFAHPFRFWLPLGRVTVNLSPTIPPLINRLSWPECLSEFCVSFTNTDNLGPVSVAVVEVLRSPQSTKETELISSLLPRDRPAYEKYDYMEPLKEEDVLTLLECARERAEDDAVRTTIEDLVAVHQQYVADRQTVSVAAGPALSQQPSSSASN
jgi:hypothetical protein